MGAFGGGGFGVDPFNTGGFGSGQFGVGSLKPIGGIDSFTKLMLHMDGLQGGTTFTDSELTPKSVTANGGAITDTSTKKFGTAAGKFPIASSSFLSVPDSTDWAFGSGAWTIDFWINLITNATLGTAVSQFQTVNEKLGIIVTSTLIEWDIKSASVTGTQIAMDSSALSFGTGTWHHVAIIRGWGGDANTFAICADGVQVATLVDSSILPDFSGTFNIGYDAESGGIRFVDAYIDEFRVSKGIARWTANFTPPSGPYTT